MDGFSEGYEYFEKNAGTSYGAFAGDKYVNAINSEIDELVAKINSYTANQKSSKILKGDVAEYWHSGTFNINAAVRGSTNRAESLKSNGLGSIDIQLNSGEKYGSKYDSTAAKSLHEQAKTFYERYKEYAGKCVRDGREAPSYDEYIRANRDSLKENGLDPDLIDPDTPLYVGQFRLVSSDQYELIKKQLLQKIEKERIVRPEQAKRYQDTLNMLRDCIQDEDGVESIKLTKEQAEKLADIAKSGGFDPIECGLTTGNLVKCQYIMEQAFKAGTTAAVISLVLKTAPEIYHTICYLIENGEVDVHQFKKIGFAALSGSAEGFVRGSIAAAIATTCKAGLIGEAMKSVNPSIIGAVTVIAMNTAQNAFEVANGHMDRKALTDELVRDMFVSSCSLAAGGIVQSVFLELPVVGFMLGSFIGSMFGGLVYSAGYQTALSFCVDTGFTMFGLVKQDYTLPENVLREMGIDVFEYEKFLYPKFEYQKFEYPKFSFDRFNVNKIEITFLRRGVIGIREIGYV